MSHFSLAVTLSKSLALSLDLLNCKTGVIFFNSSWGSEEIGWAFAVNSAWGSMGNQQRVTGIVSRDRQALASPPCWAH